ncbi:Gfo/Idh/MocA family oxidoreductase [bacterium]|nr:Gfo/Idh/MocA family oxidoreductase [bacterium]
MSKKIRWGIIGPGKIAHSFAKDLALVNNGELIAVASRNLDRATEFAKEYDAEYVFGSYDKLLASDIVDVVYIATPHTGHMKWAIKAMQHGKHVLCEKPLGVNLAEVEEMISVAQKNKVFLMEALWSRFNPSILKVKELIEQGKIGNIGHLYADFGFYALDADEKARLLNPSLAGGSILDIGIYPIFLAYFILGKPERILSTSKFHKTGVEVQTSMIFEYTNAQAVLYSGLVSKTEMKAEISGSKGQIFIDPRWHNAQGYTVELNENQEHFDLPTLGKGYTHEIKEVHRCLNAGKVQSELWSHQNSIELISILDEVRQQGGIVFPFE